jgi:hypothetical protein
MSSLLLRLCQDNSAITTATHAYLLLLSVQDGSAIMMATHVSYSLQLIVESIKADINVQESRALLTTFPMLHNRKSKFIVASHYSKTFLHFSKGFTICCEGD